MTVFSILKTYNPSLSLNDGSIAEFDAEIDMTLITRTQSTSYPVETGQEITGSLFLLPAEIKVSWAIGVRKLSPLLSEDFTSNLSENLSGFIAGSVSNLSSSGIGSFLSGVLSNAEFSNDGDSSRAFLAMSVIQKAQLTGQQLSFTIHNFGTMKNMAIMEIKVSRNGKQGGKIVFDITLSQIMKPETKQKNDQLIENQSIGEIRGIEVDD